LDAIDKGILSDLSGNCRITYEELSRKFGITANAIKRRVQKLEENKVIAGYSIALRPAMIDANQIIGMIETDGTMDEHEYVHEIGSHPLVVAAAAYTDGYYALVAEYMTPSDLAELSTYLRNLRGAHSVEIHTFITRRGKKMKLNKLHLRVIASLIKDARMSIVEIVKDTGFSARRVRRALDELILGEGVRFSALIELGAASSIPFLVKCYYDEKKITPDKIPQEFEDKYTIPYWEAYISATEPLFYCLMAVDYLSEIDDIVRSLRKEDYIKSVRPLIGFYHDYFDGPRSRELRKLLLDSELVDDISIRLPLSEY
jgi:DNA-binding Lrp family transcriptional regulator